MKAWRCGMLRLPTAAAAADDDDDGDEDDADDVEWNAEGEEGHGVSRDVALYEGGDEDDGQECHAHRTWLLLQQLLLPLLHELPLQLKPLQFQLHRSFSYMEES